MTFVGYDIIMLFVVKVAFFGVAMYRVFFIIFPITVAVSYIKPVPMGTSRDNSITQDNDKTKHFILVSCVS